MDKVDPQKAEAEEKKKEQRAANLKLKIARVHLATLELHSHVWLQHHSKAAVVRGAVDCGLGGWKDLLKVLIVAESPDLLKKCEICKKMLLSNGFDLKVFQEVVNSGEVPVIPAPAGESVHPLPLPPPVAARDVESAASQAGDNPAVARDWGAPGADEHEDGVVQQDEVEDSEEGVIELVKKDPFLQLLEPGSLKCRLPVRCLLCIRKSTGQMAVFDLVSKNRLKYWRQHVEGPTHVKNMAKARSRQDVANHFIKEEKVACMGFCPEKAEGSKLHLLVREFKIWSLYNSLAYSRKLRDKNRHKYSMDLVSNEHTVFHHSCEKVAPPQVAESWSPSHPACQKCLSIGNAKSMVRTVSRFYVKYAAARSWAKFQGGLSQIEF